MFRPGLLLIIRRHNSVYTTISIYHADNNGIVKITQVYLHIVVKKGKTILLSAKFQITLKDIKQ